MDRELSRVRELFKGIFSELKEEILKEEALKGLVGSPEKVASLIDSQEELLYEYFSNWDISAELYSKKFEEAYVKAEVPYTVVAWNIERIGSKLIERLMEGDFSKDTVLKVKAHTNNLVNQIAKIYMRRDVRSLAELKSSPFSDSALYRAHVRWLEGIVSAIERDDLSRYPLYSDAECEFAQVLEYPESLFVCIDPNMCGYVKNLHSIIHDTSNALYSLYIKGMFFQAYILFKELIEHTSKLLKTISELYFLAYSDPEGKFFELARVLSAGKDYKYVSMIDVVGLGKINSTYGREVGDRVVREVEKRLRDVLDKDKPRSLLVQGTTANFFLLNTGYSEEEIRSLVEKLSQVSNFDMNLNGRSIQVRTTIGTLELEPFIELTESEIRDILSFLKEESSKDVSLRNISVGKERRQEILSWINEKYRSVQRIKSLIEGGSVEVVLHPIVSSERPEVVIGGEALVRLLDEDKLVPAGVFIDLIYELNLIEKLDGLVLDKLESYKPFLKEIGRVFINVSPKSLASDSYLEKLCGFIRSMEGVDIVIELTEQQVMENTESVEKVARNGNVALAVDDFGSGYSSLETVAELAEKGILKLIKIDGSLIRRLLGSNTVQKVVDIISILGKRLETGTVAEFVESKEDLDMLRSIGVEYAQGFYIAKPMLVPEFLAWSKRLRR